MIYAELQVTSNYSFLRGASHPAELVTRAAALGHQAIAITDRNSLAGVVRAHVAAQEAGIQLIIGCQLVLRDGLRILAYPMDRAAYGRLCRLLTRGKRRAPKGKCWLDLDDVLEFHEGLILALVADDVLAEKFSAVIAPLRSLMPDRLYLAVSCRYRGDDAAWLATWNTRAREAGLPWFASNDVMMHDPARRELADILTCIRHGCTLDQAGYRLMPHADHHVKSPSAMKELFLAYPEALRHTVAIAERCRFSLTELSYSYPREVTSDQGSPQEVLEHLTWQGAQERYPKGVPEKIRTTLMHELQLIGQLDYAPYFLTVHDMVRFARARNILCQGRGSAANSAVCYCLGVTAVDPDRVDLLFERFISAERNEPPDIDVDFEHERREEVMQYVYEKYGRHRAGLAATSPGPWADRMDSLDENG